MVFALICTIWYAFIIILSVTGALVSYLKTRSVKTCPSKEDSEGVTILRPLKGIDCQMEDCLRSSFEQRYNGPFEIIFCIEDPNDPAVEIARKMILEYPKISSQIVFTTGEKFGPNPKINNLARGYYKAKYDIIWVLDSNVWVSPGTMARSVASFSQKVQLVHHLPLCVSTDGVSWGSKLDEMFMLTSHSKFYTAINFVGIAPCVMGKSNIYRRSFLDASVSKRLGKQIEKGTGITIFAQYIAEDNMIAQCIWDNGGKTALTGDSVVQPLGLVSLNGYWSRRVRWLRVRRYMVWAATMIEPTTESLMCLVYGLYGVHSLFNINYWLFIVLHLFGWCMVDYWHYHNLLKFANLENNSKQPKFVTKYYNPLDLHGHEKRSLSQWLPTWILREVLALPIWLVAMSGHTIYWRNRPFRILHDLSTKEIET